MTPDRWESIKTLFQAALERNERERLTFINQACLGDNSLRQEVEALLAAHAAAGDFLEAGLTALDQSPQNDGGLVSLPTGLYLCNRFEVKRLLGSGGMGDVYEALDHELGQRIAIKAIREEISGNPSVLARFKREVYATRRITHPNVCRTFDIERHVVEATAGTCERVITFLTMELLEGETLAQRLVRSGPLSCAEALELAQQTARALEAAHEAGIIHCDLKPSNIFLRHSSCGFRAVVTDFGISRFSATFLSSSIATFSQTPQSGLLAGTIAYMAPEQLEGGQTSQSSDLYSLGLVLYEAVTSTRPFKHDFPLTELTRRLIETAAPLQSIVPDIQPVYAEAVSICLKRSPTERFRTANELATFLSGSAVSAPPLNTQGNQGVTTVASPQGENSRSLLASRGREQKESPSRRTHVSILLSSLWWLIALGCVVASALVALLYRHYSLRAFNSVTVLPFMNVTKDAALDYINNGVTTSLTTDLSRVSGLAVTAESVARQVDTAHFDPEQVGRSLHVKAILTGSIARNANMLAISVELVNTADGSEIWGKNYSADTGDLAAVQEEIALEIAFRLRMKVDDNAAKQLRLQYSTNPIAYDEYLRGRYDLSKRTSAGFESALKHFQAAIDRDPNYAPAFAGLADCYALMAYNRGQPALILLSKAIDAARQALDLDNTLGEAYASLAMAETLEAFRWSSAEEMYMRATTLNPNYEPAHTWYGLTVLVPLGRYAEARAQFAYTERLAPGSLVTLASIALAEYYSRHYDLSIRYADLLRRKYPAFEVAIEILASDYIAKGMGHDAVTLITSQATASPDESAIRNALLGIAFATSGNRRSALERLRETSAAVERIQNLHYWLACLYAALDDKGRAVAQLEEAYEHRQASILFAGVDPLMDPLRHDEAFRSFLSKMNLR